MDGKSIMGILLLAAPQGSTLTIATEGPDEKEALAALKDTAGQAESSFGQTALFPRRVVDRRSASEKSRRLSPKSITTLYFAATASRRAALSVGPFAARRYIPPRSSASSQVPWPQDLRRAIWDGAAAHEIGSIY